MNDTKTRCLNRELTIEMIVGTFIASVIVVLVVFTIIISGSRIIHGGSQKLEVAFDEVGGLRRHDSVLVRGVPVGKVDALHIEGTGVLVRISLNERVVLREGYRVRVQQSSLLGGKFLAVEEGDGPPLGKQVKLSGEPPENIIENMSKLVQEVREALVEGELVGNLQKAAKDIATMTARLERGEGTLGKLLSADDTAYRDLEAALANLRAISERLEKGEGTLGKLLSADDTVYRDLQSTLADARLISGRLERGEGTLGKLLSADDTVYRDLQASLADLRAISGRLEKGEGTLGKLLSPDDTLYRDLAGTAANLRLITTRLEAGEGMLGMLLSKDAPLSREFEGLIKDARQTIDDLRETSPISTFTSIFFGIF